MDSSRFKTNPPAKAPLFLPGWRNRVWVTFNSITMWPCSHRTAVWKRNTARRWFWGFRARKGKRRSLVDCPV